MQKGSGYDRAGRLPPTWPFGLLSIALHLGVLLALRFGLEPPRGFELEIPEQIEIGLISEDPGEAGSPPPAAPSAPKPPKPPPEPDAPSRPEPPERDVVTTSLDAAVAEVADAGVAPAAAAPDAERVADVSGQGRGGAGAGLGFGEGGFGSGRGGPLGAVIGLHADLDAIRETSLILEVRAMLEIIPEWRYLLAGSGVDPLEDFSRVFVATPNLRRSSLVMSARHRRGDDFIPRIVAQMAADRGKRIAPEQVRELPSAKLYPWYSRGPTPRVLGVVAPRQFVIAREADVRRVSAVGAALAARHARQPGMERAGGAAALLSMYEGEAVALSVEGLESYIPDDVDYAPQGLRLSLRPLDEYHATLIAYGYYADEAGAARAEDAVEQLRVRLIDHPRARYLGLRVAVREATVSRQGDTVKVQAKLTMHQTRYLLAFVTQALQPRGP